MKRTACRFSPVLPTIIVLLSAVTGSAQMMGYMPSGAAPGYGPMPPQPAYGQMMPQQMMPQQMMPQQMMPQQMMPQQMMPQQMMPQQMYMAQQMHAPQPMYAPPYGQMGMQPPRPGGPDMVATAQYSEALQDGKGNSGKCRDGSCGGNGNGCGNGCGNGGGRGCGDGSCGQDGCDSCNGRSWGLLCGGLFDSLWGTDRCGFCGGGGCQVCGGSGCLGRHGPWGGGGGGHWPGGGGDGQCCYPRWFDVSADAIYLKRENVGRNQVFSAYGILGSGGVALDTESLNFDFEPGFRVTGQMLVGVGSNLEVTYFGTYNWAARAEAISNDNVYSVLSNFAFINFPDGFLETDIADLHSIEYSSTLNSIELNLRRRWISKSCHFHSSMALGARYVTLNERFKYNTYVNRPDPANIAGPPIIAGMDYNVKTRNDLIGFQLATDLWANVTPGIKIGGDLKAGIYGNRAKQTTVINTGGVPLVEALSDQQPAFVGEANLMALYHVNSHLTFRLGYQFFYVEAVALAVENFNPVAPAVLFPTNMNRVVSINNGGNAFYHGGFGGFEWTW